MKHDQMIEIIFFIINMNHKQFFSNNIEAKNLVFLTHIKLFIECCRE